MERASAGSRATWAASRPRSVGGSERTQLPADENKDAGREGENPHYYRRDGNRGDERHDANEDEINCQQQHANVFGEVHGVSSEANAFFLHA